MSVGFKACDSFVKKLDLFRIVSKTLWNIRRKIKDKSGEWDERAQTHEEDQLARAV